MAQVDERIRKINIFQRLLTRPELGSVFGLIIIVATFMLLTGPFNEWTGERNTFGPMFLNPIGIQGWVELAAFIGILAIGAALLMIAGEFDLSIGANIALSGHIFALLILWNHMFWPVWDGWQFSGVQPFNVPLPVALILTFLVLGAVGAFIGFLVVRTGLPSFIVTLGFWFASRGLAVFMGQSFLKQSRLSIKDEVAPTSRNGGEDPQWIDNVFAFADGFFSLEKIQGLQWLSSLKFDAEVYYFIILIFVFSFILLRTKYGNWIFAAGGDPVAARAVGVPVARVKVNLFILSALLACLLGVLTVMTSGASDPKAGDFRELHAIAAAVIGGCLLTGGYGSVVGAVLGAFIFAIASQGINFVPKIDNNLFRVILGTLILSAALLNQLLRNRIVKG